jgi:hypothetical protein
MQESTGDKKERPKVHVDEEWKRTAAEEKKKLREEERQRRRQEAEQPRRGPYPPPTFEGFMAGLYTQTLIALGELDNPFTGQRSTSTDEAALLVDTIAMLQAKTQGNLTVEESSYVQKLLTDLRMRYVRVTGQPQGQGEAPDPSAKR